MVLKQSRQFWYCLHPIPQSVLPDVFKYLRIHGAALSITRWRSLKLIAPSSFNIK